MVSKIHCNVTGILAVWFVLVFIKVPATLPRYIVKYLCFLTNTGQICWAVCNSAFGLIIMTWNMHELTDVLWTKGYLF